MRRVAYQSVLDRVAGLLQGLAGASGNGVAGLDLTDAAVAARFISAAAREYWERFAWPELCVVERRLFRPYYRAGNTPAAGAEVFFWPTRKYYQALRAIPNGQDPATLASGLWTVNAAYWAEASGSVGCGAENWLATTAYAVGGLARSLVDGEVYQAHTANTNVAPPNAAKWGLRTDFVRSIGLNQTGETAISVVRRIWDVDPRRTDAQQLGGHELKFDVFNDEVVVRPPCGGVEIVWAQFWTVCPVWGGELYDAAVLYEVGQTVFFTDGDFWQCVNATDPGESPVTTPASWLRLDFPQVLAEMVAWRVFGEMDPLHGSGPMGDGLTMAEGVFAQEVGKIERQQGQARQLKVMTR